YKCHFGNHPAQPPLTKTTAPQATHHLNPSPADTKPEWIINSYLTFSQYFMTLFRTGLALLAVTVLTKIDAAKK
ncbi:MAG: hypothetical protein ACKO3P_08585, partial [Planctomycetaceae bacterium]